MTNPLTRRQILQQSACGFGSLALQGLLAETSIAAASGAARSEAVALPRHCEAGRLPVHAWGGVAR